MRAGGTVALKDLAFDPMYNEIAHASSMRHLGGTLGVGAEFDVLKFPVTDAEGRIEFPEPLLGARE